MGQIIIKNLVVGQLIDIKNFPTHGGQCLHCPFPLILPLHGALMKRNKYMKE
jgi:hypothetical protein